MSGGLADSIISAESGGNATAKNPRSSATGAGQFIDGTWMDMVSRYRPDLAGLPRDQVLALRNDPALSREMVQNYADENGAKLKAAGLPDNDGTRYLSHFAGPGGARSILSADPSTPVSQVLQPGQVAATPNAWKSDDRQRFEQAKRDFVNSQLRRESGAAISQKEFDNAERQYFPVPGDGDKVIEQKRLNRQRAIEAMAREGGPSYTPRTVFDRDGALVPYQPNAGGRGTTGRADRPARQLGPIPGPAVQALQRDPSLRGQFDEWYGAGASEMFLRGR